MALKQSQYLKLSQKMLPQQILLMKLLQLPTLALEERIKEELEVNPALEEDINDSASDEELYSNENNEDGEAIGDDETDEMREAKDEEMKAPVNDGEMEDYMGDE